MAKFEDFVKKAEKRGTRPPNYKIELEDKIYEISYPDALQTLEFSKLEDNQMLDQLKVIFRKNTTAWNALVRELEGKDARILEVIVEDMFDFWNEADKTPGKSGKSEKS